MQCKESDIFNSQKNTLHKDYVDQLNVTMKEYPSFQMEKETKYSEELSKLNGITKQLTDLDMSVTTKTNELERSIEQKDADIDKLKKIEGNLSTYTTYEELDITSQQLLADAMQEYTQEKMVFFIKAAVILYLLYLLYQRIQLGSWIETQAVIGGGVVLYIVSYLYLYFTNKG
jgi:predicted RND superfamily exporter protein